MARMLDGQGGGGLTGGQQGGGALLFGIAAEAQLKFDDLALADPEPAAWPEDSCTGAPLRL